MFKIIEKVWISLFGQPLAPERRISDHQDEPAHYRVRYCSEIKIYFHGRECWLTEELSSEDDRDHCWDEFLAWLKQDAVSPTTFTLNVGYVTRVILKTSIVGVAIRTFEKRV